MLYTLARRLLREKASEAKRRARWPRLFSSARKLFTEASQTIPQEDEQLLKQLAWAKPDEIARWLCFIRGLSAYYYKSRQDMPVSCPGVWADKIEYIASIMQQETAADSPVKTTRRSHRDRINERGRSGHRQIITIEIHVLDRWFFFITICTRMCKKIYIQKRAQGMSCYLNSDGSDWVSMQPSIKLIGCDVNNDEYPIAMTNKPSDRPIKRWSIKSLETAGAWRFGSFVCAH